MSYWAEAFIEDRSSICTVVTATPQDDVRPGIFYIPDPKTSLLSRLFEGISWIPGLKAFFNSKNDLCFDYVIISGGPFGHFGISRFLKRKYRCKIILDFRDPFSRNTRFRTFILKDLIKLVFERNFLRFSDHVITVNAYCKQLLQKHVPENKITIIENGFDERIIDHISAERFDDGCHHIVYSGSFYEDRNPTVFLQTLLKHNSTSATKIVFHHIGEPSVYLQAYKDSTFLVEYGSVSYKRAIEIIKRCTIGLIVTSGQPMESTTKVYDYIGCELDTLIVTSGKPKTGSLEALTRQVNEKTFWVENNAEQISYFLKQYEPRSFTLDKKHKFSRRAGFDALKRMMERS